MTVAQIYLLAIVLIPLGLVVFNRLRIDIAALLIAVLIGLGQYLGLGLVADPNQPKQAVLALSGFAEPAVLTLLSLFILTRALDKSGFTRWMAHHVLAVGGQSERRLIVLLTTASATLSLFMNNLAAGALVLPSALAVARRTGIKPSKLLIPVAYGSLLGGAATYFTTANIISSSLLASADPPQHPLGILDFTPVGLLIAIAGIVFIGLLGPKLLPNREPAPELTTIHKTGSELESAYELSERTWEARIQPNSPLINKTLLETGIGEQLGLSVVAIWRGRTAIFAPPASQVIHVNDILLLIGREERVKQLEEHGIALGRNGNSPLSPRGVSLIEIILTPLSNAEGQSLRELEFRKNYGFTAVALRRNRRSYRTDVADFDLQPGDSVLLVGERRDVRRLKASPDFVVLEPDRGDQPIQWGRASVGILAIGGAIIASSLGVPVFLAMLLGALLLILLRHITMPEIYSTMEWSAIFLIAGMYAVSLAIVQTGISAAIGQQIVYWVMPLGPLGLAAGVFILTSLLTQFMGGQVTALVTTPIAISAAIAMGTSPQAITIASALGCSVSFFTPIAHPVNILMIEPAGYQFSDFFKIGWGLSIVCFVMMMIGMVLFWHL